MIKLHELLEVEENEEFEVRCTRSDSSTYKVLNNELLFKSSNGIYLNTYIFWQNLERFKEDIIRKPKFLKNGTEYFYIDKFKNINKTFFYGESETEFLRYKLGNFYLTREEAEANKEKWLNFYKGATQIKWEE